MWYHSGLTKLNLCQNTLAVMETLKNEITDLITLEDKSDMLREPKNVDHVVLDSTLITSEDDLRNGLFDYVVQDCMMLFFLLFFFLCFNELPLSG